MRKHSALKTFLAVLVLAGTSLVCFPENQKVVKEYTVVITGVSDSVGNGPSPPNNNICDDSANNDDRDRMPIACLAAHTGFRWYSGTQKLPIEGSPM